ncbi:carboxy terminal-processing peptidase [Motilimonas sp. 1_MG-2023]|uniref:carboxy terminal-processing peptidase n=1 Tax=Motilimonas sp. 1_MG-2023 TaxID=3062672 RepID=UPI0026E44D0A|nr:carboxy terminal-processing peptidase [Motilimonas sp. 1_MG-2023]MDO6526223.1 carboxy terminal-processing peptidase [Motilimonas sp. 1_MG-2023]
MKKVFHLTLIATSLCVAGLSFAVQPNIKVEQLPKLEQEAQHATVSKRVTQLFSRNHYKSMLLDDELSSEIFDRYIKQLDYNRNIFLESDLEQFEKFRLQLDEDLSKGRLAPTYDMFALNLQRRYERFQFALTLLDEEIKFDTPDEYVFDRSEAPWPKTTAELNEIWRQKVKHDALNLKLTGKKWPEIKKILAKRYDNAIKRLTQTQSEDVFQTVMNAYARTIEPHTSYLSPRNADRFNMEMNLSLEGIGAVLQGEEDYTVVRSLVPGGPADKTKNLNADDKIVGVAQGDEKMVDVIGWRLDDVVDLIKGPKGTTVRLEVLPAKAGSDAGTKIVPIVREKVHLEDRAAKSEVINLNNEKIGVIDIPSFYVNLSQDVDKEITKLKAENVKGIVIDLRSNGGGALTEATLLTGLFIDSGPVVQVRNNRNRIEVNADTDGEISYDGPLTVLVDRYSASASEIFAAALQDYGRALILGENTFGKGTVQQHRKVSRIYDFYEKPMGNVQYTIAKFYRIDGGSTQNKGVVPDILFPTAIDAAETGESVEDNALPWDQIKPANYSQLGSFSALIPKLDKDHKARMQASPEFAYIYQDIEEYKKEKDRKTISLIEAERVRIREEKEAQELQRVNERLARLGKKPVTKLDDVPDDIELPDPYLDEAAAITLDLAKS